MKRSLTILTALLLASFIANAADKPKPEYPMPPLVKPSGPINIDVGRQLFVDDWLIAETTLKRTFHQAKIHEGPVLKAETELETKRGTAEGAVLFDGGVWFDAKDQLFKMWYAAGFRDGIALATSKDGVRWERPNLDVSPGENRVLPYQKGWELSGFSVALDQLTKDPAQRFKMLAYHRYHNRFPGDKGEENPPAKMYVSADGIHWGEPQMVKCFTGDNVSMFLDPFRDYWVFSTRNRAPSVLRPGAMGSNGKPVTVRARFRFDGPDFIKTGLTANGAKLWLKPDADDKADPEFKIDPELYKFGAVAYESIMLGAVGMFYGPQNDVAKELKRPKIIDIQLAYSRDGVNFPRPSREDAEYVMAGGSVGLAKLRRDGFASMDADAGGGILTTSPVTFSGKFPFVNVAAKDGELRAEILDSDGKVIAPFSKENSIAISTDGTKQRLTWKGMDDLSALIGKPVRFRFHLTNAQLYAFWVSAKESGASGGYVAAGGPDFTGPRDN